MEPSLALQASMGKLFLAGHLSKQRVWLGSCVSLASRLNHAHSRWGLRSAAPSHTSYFQTFNPCLLTPPHPLAIRTLALRR